MPMNRVLRQVRQAALEGGGPLSDGQLLDRFLLHKDEAAFEALLRRHAPMVLGVCRRILHHPQDAEDAFQATFLVLVQKATGIQPRDRVGNWLHGVACRTALKSRQRRGRRQALVQTLDPFADVAAHDNSGRELQRIIDEELLHLPDKYRMPIVLCDLEARPRTEAARQLGWPEGTVATRLARARELLARRLRRHGFPLTGVALVAALARPAAARTVPAALLSSTAATIQRFATGTAPANAVTVLAKEMMQMLFWHRLKLTVMALGALVVLGAGVALVSFGGPGALVDDLAPARLTAQTNGSVPAGVSDFAPQAGGLPTPASGSPPGQAQSLPASGLPPLGDPGGSPPTPGSESPAPGGPTPKPAPTPEGGSPLGGDGSGKKDKVGVKHATGIPLSVEVIETELAAAIDVKFNNVRFPEVIAYLRDWSKLNIVVDERALNGDTLDTPILLDLKAVTLKTVLKHVLLKVDLKYYIEDGVVVISKVEFKTVRRIYPVGDLLGDTHEKSAKELMGVITKIIDTETWSELGGRGAIEYFPGTKCLIVNQATEVHESIQQLLDDLRKAKKSAGKQ